MTTEENLEGHANTSYKWKIVQIIGMTILGMLLLLARELHAF